jgi:protein ImuB
MWKEAHVFGAICRTDRDSGPSNQRCLAGSLRDPAEGTAPETLAAVAREFSPRIEVCGPREVTLDLSGLERLFGTARTIGDQLRRTAADHGIRARVAIAGTRTAARLVVRHWAGVTVVEAGTEAQALAVMPLELLAVVVDAGLDLLTLRRWGLQTLGDLAALPPDAVAARLGQQGVEWQRLARGEDPRPLLPSVPDERFEQALDLEWPIDGLEPLSFVLGRLMEPLSAHLERRGRGAAVLHVRLHLITRDVHERSLQLPAPMRDARALRTLALLDLESHPPSAAVDRVVVAVDPTPGRVLQFSLLARPLPSPEQISTLMARLAALMGEDRCGAPAAVDSWQPGAFAMKPFAPREDFRLKADATADVASGTADVASGFSRKVAVALRRFRFPVPARVRVTEGKPAYVSTDRRGLAGGCVHASAGPWRTSGAWWSDAGSLPAAVCRLPAAAWDRDEWDVALSDGATYRVFRDRGADAWFIEGVVD